jgi:hypothetical protein
MQRAARAALAAIVLVLAPVGVAAAAGQPVPPQISDVTATWGWYEWDDGSLVCTLITDARLEPGFTRGQPVFARAYVHYTWVGEAGGTWQEFNFATVRLRRGDASVHAYVGFIADGGYYVVDQVRFDLTTRLGDVFSSRSTSTANTCANG